MFKNEFLLMHACLLMACWTRDLIIRLTRGKLITGRSPAKQNANGGDRDSYSSWLVPACTCERLEMCTRFPGRRLSVLRLSQLHAVSGSVSIMYHGPASLGIL